MDKNDIDKDIPYRTHLPRRWKGKKVHCRCNSGWERNPPGTIQVMIDSDKMCPRCAFYPWIVVTTEEHKKMFGE